jgi:hypothetical protein
LGNSNQINPHGGLHMTYNMLGPELRNTRSAHSSRTDPAIISRRTDGPYWGNGDYDGDERAVHPAILTDAKMHSVLRGMIVLGAIMLCAMFLGACSTYEHRDGGGYTVRYASAGPLVESAPPPPRVRKVVYIAPRHTPASTVLLVEPDRDRGESHPVLNVGKDDEIPREYRHYVSDRALRTLRARNAMCKEARPGQCNAPNVAHCHGPFCHAHSGGDKRHTH